MINSNFGLRDNPTKFRLKGAEGEREIRCFDSPRPLNHPQYGEKVQYRTVITDGEGTFVHDRHVMADLETSAMAEEYLNLLSPETRARLGR